MSFQKFKRSILGELSGEIHSEIILIIPLKKNAKWIPLLESCIIIYLSFV